MSDEAQFFVSGKSEWDSDHSAFSGQELKGVEKNYRLIVLTAGSANDAIKNSGLPISPFEVSISGTMVANYEKKGDVLESFTRNIHGEVLSLVDDPFNDAVTTTLGDILVIAERGLAKGENNLEDDIKNILNGTYDTCETVVMDEATVQALQELLGEDGTQVFLGYLKDCAGDTGIGTATKYYYVDGYRFTISKDGNKIRLVDVLSRVDGKNNAAKEFMDKLAKTADGNGWQEFEIRRILRQDGVPVNRMDLSDLQKNYPELGEYITIRQSGTAERMAAAGRAGITTFRDSFNYPKQVSEAKVKWQSGHKVAAVADAAGIVMDVITVGVDLHQNNTDYYGNADVTVANVQRGITDAVVDLTTGAGAAATGAVIGTFIGGPVGTAVGFLVGAGIDLAMSYIDVNGDGKGLTDDLKDFADDAVDFMTGGATA
ncbi:MAG: hypothetical protein K6G10_09555 [Butyrivibrio sp.]|nr:hypothetical protein [Butyrivibrio sp.]